MRRLRADERGMTVIEVVVAGMIMVVGGLGVLGIVDAASRNTFRAEQSQALANLMQGEIERLRQLPYDELALEELPVHVADPKSPDSRVSSTSFFYTGRDNTGLKPLVYNGANNGGETIEGGTVDPGPTPFQNGNIRGDIYRYVVWDTCPSALCTDGKYLKRAIVVARLDETASGGERRYQEIQGQFVDPDAEPAEFPSQQPGGSDDLQWTLWLTDTPCDQPGRLPHPETEGDHPSHNTRGDCAQGVQEGNTPGAPDLLWPVAPELPPKEDEEEEGFPGYPDYNYDYASELEPQPDADEGLQLLPGGECDSPGMTSLAAGAATEPDADEDAFRRVHRWLSPPMPATASGDDVLLTGEGTLSLWSRTVSEAVYKGRVCAWIFVRGYDGETITDTMVVNLGPPQTLHFDRFESAWPSVGWTEVSLPLSFGYAGEGGALPLPEGSRLGLAIAVGGDTPTGLQFLYDEPSFDSRLELATTGAPPPEA
jgi:hypothetical protein